MVQTEDQYIFIHDAILEYLRSMSTEVTAVGLRDYIRDKTIVDPRSGQ